MIERIVQSISQEADQAAQRYNALTERLALALHQSLYSSSFASQSAKNELSVDVYGAAKDYLAAERQLVFNASDGLLRQGLEKSAAELGVQVSQITLPAGSNDHFDTQRQFLLTELSVQAERDIAIAQSHATRIGLQVQLTATGKGVSRASALNQQRIKGIGEVKFRFNDRRGRQWLSHKYARTVFRHNLLHQYNDLVMTIAADHGLDHVVVNHVEKDHRFAGLKVGLHDDSQFPAYETLVDDVFHPNANAVLGISVTPD